MLRNTESRFSGCSLLCSPYALPRWHCLASCIHTTLCWCSRITSRGRPETPPWGNRSRARRLPVCSLKTRTKSALPAGSYEMTISSSVEHTRRGILDANGKTRCFRTLVNRSGISTEPGSALATLFWMPARMLAFSLGTRCGVARGTSSTCSWLR
jgi:hypothetical protein